MGDHWDALDRLVSELASIQDRLLADPPLAERVTLHSRREELQARGRDLRKSIRDRLTLEQARAQLAHLEERHFALAGAHVPHAHAPATEVGGGMAQRDLSDLYAASLEAFERDEVEHEIRRLQQQIASLEAD